MDQKWFNSIHLSTLKLKIELGNNLKTYAALCKNSINNYLKRVFFITSGSCLICEKSWLVINIRLIIQLKKNKTFRCKISCKEIQSKIHIVFFQVDFNGSKMISTTNKTKETNRLQKDFDLQDQKVWQVWNLML